jgi:hypothetical protein
MSLRKLQELSIIAANFPSVENINKAKEHFNKYTLLQNEEVKRLLNHNILLNYIVEYLCDNEDGIKSYKPLYDFVKDRLNGYYCYYTNKNISKENFEGRIRSVIEEHSSDSRQHYFRKNKLQARNWRLNIFNNRKLGEMNELNEWKPYRYSRGDVWKFGKGKSNPSNNMLEEAEKLYNINKIGRRRGRGIINDDNMYKYN